MQEAKEVVNKFISLVYGGDLVKYLDEKQGGLSEAAMLKIELEMERYKKVRAQYEKDIAEYVSTPLPEWAIFFNVFDSEEFDTKDYNSCWGYNLPHKIIKSPLELSEYIGDRLLSFGYFGCFALRQRPERNVADVDTAKFLWKIGDKYYLVNIEYDLTADKGSNIYMIIPYKAINVTYKELTKEQLTTMQQIYELYERTGLDIDFQMKLVE